MYHITHQHNTHQHTNTPTHQHTNTVHTAPTVNAVDCKNTIYQYMSHIVCTPHTMQWTHTPPYNDIQHNTTPYNIIQHNTVHTHTVQHYMQLNTYTYHTQQRHNTIQHTTINNNPITHEYITQQQHTTTYTLTHDTNIKHRNRWCKPQPCAILYDNTIPCC